VLHSSAVGARPGRPAHVPECHLAGRALRTLELLAAQPLSAPQVADALRVAPRTARRLLKRLVEDGWVTRSEGRVTRYSPTLRVAPLAAVVVERHAITAIAAAHVAAVSAQLEGPAHLMMPSPGGALCILHDEGSGPRAGVGELVPWHAGAEGRALLAWSDGGRERGLRSPMPVATARAIPEPRSLLAAAADAVVQGYATEDGERRPGTRTVAAPVLDRDGVARWTLSVDVPAGRCLHRAGRFVTEHAGELGARWAAGA
jgi:IclR family transcriptional regulator, acetate operon repressor